VKIIVQILFLATTALLATATEPTHDLFRVRRVTDVTGTVQSLRALPDVKAVVLVFLGPECPISQRYIPELNRIATQHGTNAVEFWGVISGPSMQRTQALAFAKEYAIEFPVLFDDAGQLARWLRPTHMPEAFALKPDGDVMYHGRINDWYESPGKPRAVVKHHELRDALTAMLKGKSPPRIFAAPVGCYFEDWSR